MSSRGRLKNRIAGVEVDSRRVEVAYLRAQINKLANYFMTNLGEPSQSPGEAVDMAIRIMETWKAEREIGRPGILHPVDKSFYDLAIGERDAAQMLYLEAQKKIIDLRDLPATVEPYVEAGEAIDGRLREALKTT